MSSLQSNKYLRESMMKGSQVTLTPRNIQNRESKTQVNAGSFLFEPIGKESKREMKERLEREAEQRSKVKSAVGLGEFLSNYVTQTPSVYS